MGTAAFALQECSKPDIKSIKSAMMDTKIRIGDVDTRPEEAIELHVKTSKCTAISRPPSMKKYAKRQRQADVTNVDGEDIFTLLEKKTQYIVERDTEDRVDDTQLNEEDSQDEETGQDTVEKEDLVRGYKYGASFVPVDAEDDFKRLEAKSGIDICGFFPSKNVSPISYGQKIKLIPSPGSSAVIGAWAKCSIFGVIQDHPENKLHSRLWCKRCLRSRLWPSRGGSVEAIQKWASCCLAS